MFDFIKTSLKNKLLISFLSVGILPFLVLFLYTLFLSETQIVKKTTAEQFNRANVVIALIQNHLDSIAKEINFLSSLDLMDDILADDIDNRISILLDKKVNDLDEKVEIFVVNEKSKIISSSNINSIAKTFIRKKKGADKEHYYFIKENIFFYSPIYASFDKKKIIGFIYLKYNLSNINHYLIHEDGFHSYITLKKSNFKIGDNMHLDFSLIGDKNSIITKNYFIVYKKFTGKLKQFYFVYAVEKDLALKFLNDFLRFMYYVSGFILLIIIYISLKYSKDIVKPIENLTNATNNIVQESDYSMELLVNSQDEIGILTQSFNNMLKTINSALGKLEEENKLRLKRFISLIEVFNNIILTQSESECIEVSIQEIKKLTNKKDLAFHKEGDKNSVDVYTTDFEHNKKIYFGSISLSVDDFKDKNEKDFYNSIATMVSLQLDRINLISRAMAVSKAKSAFISNMSHELRTPLNAIIGFSQFLITYEELTEDQQDTVANIESSAHYLLNMINEILDIAKIEAGKMEAHLEETSLLDLVNNSYNMLKPLANDKKLEFNLISDNLSLEIFQTDPKMFQQIIVNLLSNSIKFTQEGFVNLEIYNDDISVVVKVSDSGIGIAKDDLQKLFSDFTQVENVMQKKHKGTGLGLSLSKKMANILHGDIVLTSAGLGHGSTSTFSLPIRD